MKQQLFFNKAFAHLLIGTFAYTALCPESGARAIDYNNKTFHPMENEDVRKYMKTKPVKFLENKGQMTDMDGKPVPFVLFKAEAPGMDMYITENGLSYVFNQFHEEEIKEEEKAELNEAEEQGIEKKKKWITWDRIDMTLKGASIKKENIIKEGMSEDFSQYFLGHCPNGIMDVRAYEKIIITNVYPNIDWSFYNSTDKGFKYDFIVHPGADPKQIELIYSSLNRLILDQEGNLNINTEIGILTEKAPYSFIKETNQEVENKYVISGQQKHSNYFQTSVKFQLSNFEISNLQTLIIDPQLWWATFYGGSGSDRPHSIITDNLGNLFITGQTESINFPVMGSGTQGFCSLGNGCHDAFIAKFSNTGVPLWATYYGGNSNDIGYSITADAIGNVFVTGFTLSTNFPSQSLGTFFQQNYSGGNIYGGDVFILKFDNLGTRLWATYYGGSGGDRGYSITADAIGNVFVTGYTNSSNFPICDTCAGFQGIYRGGQTDVFILKFDNMGNRLWATYYGGTRLDEANSITTDRNGNVFVTGSTASSDLPVLNTGTYFQNYDGNNDGFILKFDNVGNPLWATFYGGTKIDVASSIVIDGNGNAFVTGHTYSSDFPVFDAGSFFQDTLGSKGTSDAFILKFDNAGNRLWATYYGGTLFEISDDGPRRDNLAIDSCGNVYIAIETGSTNIRTQSSCDGGYFDNTYNGSGVHDDNFILHFSDVGELLWATYLGGNAYDCHPALAIDNAGSLFVTGIISLEAIPVTYPLVDPDPGGGTYYQPITLGQYDGFIIKFKKIPLILNTVVNNSCGCNASATVMINESCAPYNYLWSNGQTTQMAMELCADSSYMVKVTDNACSIGTASVTIIPTPPPTSDFTIINPVCIGANSIIAYTGSATSDAIYSWDFDGGTVKSGSGQGPYTVYWSTSGTKNVTLTVTEDGCTSALTIQVITVIPVDDASFTYSSGTFCQLDADPSPTVIGLAGGIFTSTAGLSIDSSTGLIDLAASMLGSYTVTYTTNGPCSNASTFNITITLVPDASFSYNGPYCQNETTNPSPAFPSGASAGVFSTMPEGLVFVNASTGQIDLAASTPGTYTISNSISSSGGCIASSANNTVSIFPIPVLTITNPSEVCSPETVDLTAAAVTVGSSGGGTLSYWEDAAATIALVSPNMVIASGTYYIKSATAEDCFDIKPVEVIINQAPMLSVSPVLASICIGQSITLIAKAQGSAATYTYNWIPGNLNDSVITVSPSVTTIYTVTVTDVNNCKFNHSVDVVVHPLPVISFTAIPNNGCAPLCVSFNNTTPNASTASWDFGNAKIASDLTAFYCYPQPGNYSIILSVRDNNGCTNSLTIPDFINVFPKPMAAFTMAPLQSVTVSSPIFFNDRSTSADHWFWNFGDFVNSTSTQKDLSFSYSEVGAYTVTLIVTTNEGCADTASQVIDIKPDFIIYIPNAFTPDNDGINDFFAPQGIEFNSFEMEIYNRWGEKIYHTSEIDKPWDGRNKGGTEVAKQDVYVYKIWVKDFKDETHYYVGNVSLIK